MVTSCRRAILVTAATYCFLSLPIAAVRTGVGAEDTELEGELIAEKLTVIDEECPGVCLNLNYAFMKAEGMSDQKVREEVNKKCRFSMCKPCRGGGKEQIPSIPCCSEECELKSETPSLEDMAAAIGKSDELEEIKTTIVTTQETTTKAPLIQKTTSSPPVAEDSTTTTPDNSKGDHFWFDEAHTFDEGSFDVTPFLSIVEEYKAAQGEVCSYDHGQAWCQPPATNPGNQYRKDGKPLCCKQVTELEMRQEDEDIEQEADEWLENTKKPSDEQKPVIDPGCNEGSTFSLQTIMLKDVSKTVCMSDTTKLPADVKCCASKAHSLVPVITAEYIAEKECGDVLLTHCKSDIQHFEKYRNTKYKGKIPAGFTCKRMYWCVDQSKRLVTEKVGPVDRLEMCGDLQLSGYRTCAAVKDS